MGAGCGLLHMYRLLICWDNIMQFGTAFNILAFIWVFYSITAIALVMLAS